jgi:hypothetical protein
VAGGERQDEFHASTFFEMGTLELEAFPLAGGEAFVSFEVVGCGLTHAEIA